MCDVYELDISSLVVLVRLLSLLTVLCSVSCLTRSC